MKARARRREMVAKVLKERRSPRRRGRMGTSAWNAPDFVVIAVATARQGSSSCVLAGSPKHATRVMPPLSSTMHWRTQPLCLCRTSWATRNALFANVTTDSDSDSDSDSSLSAAAAVKFMKSTEHCRISPSHRMFTLRGSVACADRGMYLASAAAIASRDDALEPSSASASASREEPAGADVDVASLTFSKSFSSSSSS